MSATTSPPLSNVIAIDSSSLASIAYDVERMNLRIEFRDRSVYQYLEVSRQDLPGLVAI
jgi:hypothetical protein